MTNLSPKGWTNLGPVGADASARSYSRVEKNGHTAILMDCSRDNSEMQNFVRLSKWINSVDLKAPEIYEEGSDYLIVEDFGDLSFKKAGLNEDHYKLASDVLKHFAEQKPPPGLPEYYADPLHKGRQRVIDWYAPLIRHKQNEPDLLKNYLAAWDQIEKSLPKAKSGFVHADYHVENLIYIPGEKGLKRCGIIDFQSALLGPQIYDLGNLLEDARVTVPQNIKDDILKSYSDTDKAWLRVLATQFHCRVIGQFIKLAAKSHKTGYLQYIPVVQGHIRAALKDPLLVPLKTFFEDNNISFDTPPDLKDIKSLVSPDAF